jgi:PKD repeat protein
MNNIKTAAGIKARPLLVMLLALSCLAACKQTDNYSLGPLPTASFTATPLSSNPNKIVVTSTTKGAFEWLWNFGNNTTSRKQTDTVIYDKKGTYQIMLYAFGQGGYDSTTQSVTIAADIQGLNLVKGGDMSDASAWSVLNTGGEQTTVTFKDGAAVFTTSGNSNGGIYQALQVEAGAQYKFSANVEGSGATNTWFEVYFGATKPTDGQDYTDNKFVSLNTWSGCGTGPFNGDIANIGCSGSGTDAGGIITFATSGTVYLVIKAGASGGGFGADGITLDNVSLIKL